MKKRLLIIVQIALVTTACTNNEIASLNDHETLIKALSQTKSCYIVDPNKIASDILDNQYGIEKTESPFMLYESCKNSKNNALLKMTSDVFNAIRLNYIAYNYCGGDYSFGEAFKSVSRSITISSDIIESPQYIELLESNIFPLIHDRHFSIDDSGIEPNIFYYSDFAFYPCANGWYYLVGNKETLVYRSRKNQKLLDHLLPTLKSDGSIAWVLIFRDNPGNPVFLQIGLFNRMTLPVYEFRNILTPNGQNGPINVNFSDNIPIAHITECPEPPDSIQSERFLSTSLALRDYPACIIDLSLNSGGYTTLFESWFSSYLRGKYYPNEIFFSENGMYQSSDMIINRIENDIKRRGGSYISPRLLKLDKRDDNRIKIILQSHKTASSAEFLILDFKTIKRTITVGQFSWGGVRWSAVHKFIFSKPLELEINMASAREYYLENIEERPGLSPTFILLQRDSEKTALAFIDRYGVEAINSAFNDIYNAKQ